MTFKQTDITMFPISQTEIGNIVGHIFPDLLILDIHFRIVCVSSTIVSGLSYDRNELLGKEISVIAKEYDLIEKLKMWLIPGYFDGVKIELTSKEENKISFALSGFYLGLVTNINGLIVLRMRLVSELGATKEALEAKTVELDDFIYHSAHHLRGPIATLKGLINLLKISPEDQDTQFIVQQMEECAQSLDDKLFRLICFAESDKVDEEEYAYMNVEMVFLKLYKMIQQESTLFPIHFEYSTLAPLRKIKNARLVFSMLQNLLVFFNECDRLSTNRIVLEDVSTDAGSIDLVIHANGFSLNEISRQKLNNSGFGYPDILNYPELINCYAAKKIAYKLQGFLRFYVLSDEQVFISIVLPC